ncbi:unnamed protein product [Symbiodinium sp. CCMP2456]|nr:unnamed protein product [Symbiodinium sp. CCMP2456]
MSQPKITLTSFNMRTAAEEKVYLALVMTGTEFENKFVDFMDWGKVEAPQTPFNQQPIMTVTDPDGTVKTFAQSAAMMRWAARKLDSTDTLYPADPDKMLEIEEAISLSDDMAKAWQPALNMGEGLHAKYGHPQVWPEFQDTVKKLRETFIAESLPLFMFQFSHKLEATGAFFCGDKPTIADLQILAQLRYFTRGEADHVPADCLAPYTAVTSWMDRMYAIPQIKAWYKL